MISVKAAVEKRGALLNDPHALEVFRQEMVKGAVSATELVLTTVVAATPVGQSATLWKAWFKQVQMGIPFLSLTRNPTPYGEIVEKGSRPHLIAPRNKKALAFLPGATAGTHTWAEASSSGDRVVRRVVHHPGTKGKHFVQKTVDRLNDAGSPLERLWERVVSKIVERLS